MRVLIFIIFTLSLVSISFADQQVDFSMAQYSVGYLSRSDKTPAVRHEAFSILCNWILHDDAEFRIPADELLKLAEEDPKYFYLWMTDSGVDPGLRNEWLSSIQTSSFTAGYIYDNIDQMEIRRKKLIEVFAEQKVSTAQGDDLRRSILKTLRGVTVGKVE